MAIAKKMTQVTMQIMEALLGSDDLNDAMAEGLELLVNVLESTAGAIWVRDKEEDLYYPLYQIGPADLTNMRIRGGGYAEGKTASDGRSRMTGQDGETEKSAFEAAGMSVQNLLCVPLNNLQQVIGTLAVANRKDGKPYTDDELKLCEQMAALAAMTMEEKGYSLETVRQGKPVLIEARKLCKDYPSGEGSLRVLRDLNINIYEGEFVVLLGESGCGKSTLVNIIAGMDNLTEGSLTIEGKDFSRPSDADLTAFRRNDVGFVFQSYNLMPNLTALENVQFLAELVPEPMDAREALGKVGLAERADYYPSQLSGGQQQRVSIARAIVKRPKLVFADEPTAALDYETSIEVLGVFEEIVRSADTTVVMITHNPEIAKMADRVIRIRNGAVSGIKINQKPARAKDLVW